MNNLDTVKAKMSKLARFLEELREVSPAGSLSEYRADTAKRRSCERLIQLIVECAADINSILVVESGHPAPRDYYDTFIKAGESGVISTSLSKKLAPWAGLRNRLVHEYEDIKDRIVYFQIPHTLQLFEKFLREVREFVKRVESHRR